MSATETALLQIECSGSPIQRGQAQGEAFRSLIEDVIVRWKTSISARHTMDPDAYITDFLTATSFLPTIERYTPGLLEEVRGIADGCGQSFETMLAYNLMDEEWTYGSGRLNQQPGCTVACLAFGDRPAVVAQTMDIPSLHDGTQVVVTHRYDTAPDQVVFTGAGMIALNGANSAGIGVVVNNLSVLPSSPMGLPVLFVIRGILERENLQDAVAFCEGVPHAIGQHYAIGSPQGIAGLEAAANGVIPADTSSGRYVHANHPLVNTSITGDPQAKYALSRTFIRHNRAVELIEDAADQSGIENLLMDETAPISCAPRSGFMTFGGTSILCSVPPVVRVAPGPPHSTPWIEVGALHS